MIEELAEHGCELSAGTVYPMLHGMEEEGLLECQKRVVEGRVRKYYHLTPAGEKTFHEGLVKANELLKEISEES